MAKKLSWMDEELKNAIVVTFDKYKKANKTTSYGEFADKVIKQYVKNKKRFKKERNKWIDDTWEENAKDLLNK